MIKMQASKKVEQLKRIARPVGPGAVVADLIQEMGITQGQLAQALGVGRVTVNQLVTGKRSVTPDMAQRLGKFFGNGPALWLNMQHSIEMWDMLHADTTPYEHIRTIEQAA